MLPARKGPPFGTSVPGYTAASAGRAGIPRRSLASSRADNPNPVQRRWLLVKGHSKVRRWNSPGTAGSSRSIRPEARLSPAHPSRYLRSVRPAPLGPVVTDPTLFAAAAPRRPVKGHAGSAHAVPPVWPGYSGKG